MAPELVGLIRESSNHAAQLDTLLELRKRLEVADPAEAPAYGLIDGWSGRDPSERRRVADRLPADALPRLVEQFRAGATINALVEQYGISASTVKRILRRSGARRYSSRIV